MLSSLPKLADRAFILGTFLPTLLFAACLLGLFHDYELVKTWRVALAAKDLGQAVFLLFAVWVLAVLTLLLNHWIYRLLEGYMFPSWVAEPLKNRNRKRLHRSLQRLDMEKNTTLNRGAFWFGLLQLTPLRDDEVLPTRFGNAIRAFETYASEIYGADTISIWPRLTSVMSKEVMQQIQDARSRVDFFINCCLFSFITALLALMRIMLQTASIYYANDHQLGYAVISGMGECGLWLIGGIMTTYVSPFQVRSATVRHRRHGGVIGGRKGRGQGL
jgi:hypothetical protein